MFADKYEELFTCVDYNDVEKSTIEHDIDNLIAIDGYDSNCIITPNLSISPCILTLNTNYVLRSIAKVNTQLVSQLVRKRVSLNLTYSYNIFWGTQARESRNGSGPRCQTVLVPECRMLQHAAEPELHRSWLCFGLVYSGLGFVVHVYSIWHIGSKLDLIYFLFRSLVFTAPNLLIEV